MSYTPFIPHRSVRDFRQSGRLPNHVLDSLAMTITRHLPDEYAVIGETVYEDGRTFLEFAVTTAYIEATTIWRHDAEQHRLRLVCPACGLKDGRHTKGCEG